MSASHGAAHMDVPQAHELVDSHASMPGGRPMPTAEVAQMEAAAEYGFAQQLATEAATMPGELLLPLLPGFSCLTCRMRHQCGRYVRTALECKRHLPSIESICSHLMYGHCDSHICPIGNTSRCHHSSAERRQSCWNPDGSYWCRCCTFPSTGFAC